MDAQFLSTTHDYAGILLVTSDGRFVCQQRDDKPGIDNPGKVATFGGTVEEGETPRYAAWRELTREETNLSLAEEDLTLYYQDVAHRPLTDEYESRHFFFTRISDEQLDSLEVYEGQRWVYVDDENDTRLVDSWRTALQAYRGRSN